MSIYLYRPQRSCGQGNIFTPVCHSVHRGGSASVHAGIPPPLNQADPPRTRQTPPQDQADTPPDQADAPPRPGRLQHTVYERPVRILLECILVSSKIMSCME